MPKLPGMPQPVEPPPRIHEPPFFTLIYDTTFLDGSLNPDVDSLGMGPLEFGDSELDNYAPGYSFVDGELVLSVELPLPDPNTPPPVTAGMFATFSELPFNTYQPFALKGTYVAPSGATEGTWAVGILARTGGLADLASNLQVVATLQFNALGAETARLNLPKGATKHTPVPLPVGFYNEIMVNEVPFTLTLFLDRNANMGSAYLTVGQPEVTKLQLEDLQTNSGFVGPQTFAISNFPLADFRANSGYPITAVGTVIANSTAYGAPASVHVRDFQIYATV